jgi:hypothetical protein
VPPGAGKESVAAAAEGHVLAEAQLVGVYARGGLGPDLPDDPVEKKLLQDRASIYTAPLG